MIQLDRIFAGNTPSEQRKFLKRVLVHLRPKVKRLVMPAVGQFAQVRVALESGFKPGEIETSDISLFSSVLGYFYAGRAMSELPVTLRLGWCPPGLPAEPIGEIYSDLKSEEERAALLLWIVKICQLNPNRTYDRMPLEDLWHRRERHVSHLARTLVEAKKLYGGISYSVMDLREHARRGDPETLIVVNPPAYSSGYTKMFPLEAALEWRHSVAEFDLSAEFGKLWSDLKKQSSPVISLVHENAYKSLLRESQDTSDLVFCIEKNKSRLQYYAMTKPELLDGSGLASKITRKEQLVPRPYKAPTWRESDDLVPGLPVRMVFVDEEVALYYRELWVHKLGSVRAEIYTLILIGGKVFAVVGFHGRDLRALRRTPDGSALNRIYETFGVCFQTEKYPRLTRLMMLIITTRECGNFLKSTVKKNRVFKMDGLRTTCLSKYRHVKHHTGVFNRLSREKLPGGLYKLVYDAEFRPEKFGDALGRYLKELKEPEDAREHVEA